MSDITISPNTIRGALKHQGLQYVAEKKGPLLMDHHKHLRHERAKKDKDWT
jgi:hypothetical protein